MNQHVTPPGTMSSTPPTAAADPFAQARQYLARVLPWPNAGETPAYVNIHWTFQGENFDKPAWTGRAVSSVNEAINAIQFALKGANTRDIYVCLSTQRESEERTSANGFKYRVPIRSQQNAVALRSLFLDIDCKGEGYANLNEAVVALAGFLKATGLPKPSIMVASGGGLHVYWVVSRALTPDEWKPLAYALAEATKQHGLKCDTQVTIDSARVLRIPNTFNRKTDPARPVTHSRHTDRLRLQRRAHRKVARAVQGSVTNTGNRQCVP